MRWDDLEIFGFDGSPGVDGSLQVECGRALPVLRIPATAKYILISDPYTDLTGATILDEVEMVELESQHRLTRLPRPCPASRGKMIFYATQRFLGEVAGQPLSLAEVGEWHLQELPGPAGYWAGCASLEETQSLFNRWTQKLLDKCQALLVAFFSGQQPSCETAEQVAQMALDAVADRTLQQEVYLSLGVALMYFKPHQLESSFKVISRKYPAWDWADFRAQVQNLAEALQMRASASTAMAMVVGATTSATLRQTSIEPHRSDECGELVCEILAKAETISNIRDEEKRMTMSDEAAQAFRAKVTVTDTVRAKIESLGQQVSGRGTRFVLALGDDEIIALCREPAFFEASPLVLLNTPEVVFAEPRKARAALNLLKFRWAARFYNEHHIEQGRIAELALAG